MRGAFYQVTWNMAEITAQSVRDLRERTGLPMMECKQALVEASGDSEAAMEWLRKKHKGKMQERADRETGEGRIGVYVDEARKVGALVELKCETAPVAGNDRFIKLAGLIAQRVAEGSEQSPSAESLMKAAGVEAAWTETFGVLRETMNLGRSRKVTGNHVVFYVHHDGKTAVMLALDSKPSDPEVAANLCMHTAFAKPLAIDRNGVPAEEVERVKKLARETAEQEGKKGDILEKIVKGKADAFCAEQALVEQLHARSDVYGKKKVGDVLKEAGVSAVTDMVVMKLGA